MIHKQILHSRIFLSKTYSTFNVVHELENGYLTEVFGLFSRAAEKRKEKKQTKERNKQKRRRRKQTTRLKDTTNWYYLFLLFNFRSKQPRKVHIPILSSHTSPLETATDKQTVACDNSRPSSGAPNENIVQNH